MKEFNDVKWLIRQLTTFEQRVLLKIVSIQNESVFIDENLSLKLIRTVFKDPLISEDSVSIILYGSIKKVAFRKLLQRVEEKIMDVLLLHGSIICNSNYDQRAREILMLRKKLLQFDMLWMRGGSKMILQQLDKIIDKAEKYEYYEILLFALYKKRNLLAVLISKAQYKLLSEKINYFEICRKSLLSANEYVHQTGIIKIRINGGKKDWKGQVELYRNNLYSVLKLVKSCNIERCLLYIEIEYFICEGDLKRALDKSLVLMKFVKNNLPVYTSMRYESALLNVILLEAQSYLFESAFTRLKEVGKMMKRHFYNHFILSEMTFLICLFSSKIEDFTKQIKIMKNLVSVQKERSEFSLKTDYFQSILDYLSTENSNNKMTFKNYTSQDLPDDKWKFSQRVFQIQLLIESEKFEQADFQIENNRKFVERLKKSEVLNARQAVISKILVELSRKSYDFKKVWKSRRKELDLLDSVDPDYRWQIMSPELVVFHEWFQAQLNHEKYDHGKVMAKMKAKISPVVQKPLLTLPADGGSKHNRRVSARVKGEKLASA